MSSIIDPVAFDRATAPLFGLLSAEQLRRLGTLSRDEALDSRIADLAARAEEDELSEAEKAEYEGYLKANNLLAVLQGIARRRLEAGAAR